MMCVQINDKHINRLFFDSPLYMMRLQSVVQMASWWEAVCVSLD